MDGSHDQPERWCGSQLRSLSDSTGPAAAMAPPLRPLPKLRLLLSVAAALLMMSLPVSALQPETCFSRQHQSATVDVRVAASRTTTVMGARVVRTERDCVLACCSEEVQPGARCNMAVFNSNKPAGEDNCILFHCQSEQDCPLMKAQDGINVYDIYKGLSHPPTLRPVTMTTGTVTTTTPATTTLATTTPTTTTTMAPTTTTQAPPTTTEPSPIVIIIATSPPTAVATTRTTTAALSSTLITRKPNKTSKKQNKTTKKGKPHPTDAVTTTRPAPGSTTSLPVVTEIREHRTTETPKPHTTTTTTAAPTTITTTPTTTTTTPTSTTTTTTTATTTPTSTTPTTTTTTPTTTTTTTTAIPTSTTTTTPTTTTTTIPTSTTTPTTTTTTPTSTTTIPTTTSPPTTTTTTEPSIAMTTPATSLIIVPKDALQPGHTLQNSNAGQGKTLAAQGALKSGVVAFMVLGLAVLMLALAVGGRKAMESFDRRHYTRLELNDLHYEV
ncbi:MANSC domain-containing protein 1 isoform X1 [Leuresthes tenuis]|uniref:MANSC domain-containing protein 1 isoform X1 n=2 Tax=Leuresthes tenuis TaxID=355514 RepID=UPI003B507E52